MARIVKPIMAHADQWVSDERTQPTEALARATVEALMRYYRIHRATRIGKASTEGVPERYMYMNLEYGNGAFVN
jgi:hypothetical protein